MKNHCFHVAFVVLTMVLCYPTLCAAQERVLSVGREELRFTPRPERGYVVKLAERAGGIGALSEVSAFDVEHARPIRGLDRHGVYTVENAGPAAENERTLARLRRESRVRYAAPLFSSNGETVAIIPEIVIRVKPGTDPTQVEALCRKAGCTIRKRMEFTEQEYLLEVLGPDAEAVFAAVEELGQAPTVEWACPNTASRPKLSGQPSSAVSAAARYLQIASAEGDPNLPGVFPNDEYFPMQWHLHNTGQSGGTPGADIRAPEAGEITTGNPNIVIAVLDSGVDAKHPDLANSMVPGYDFVDSDDLADPVIDTLADVHGTGCAGLMAAQGNNTIGVVGVTWNCKVMPIRIGTLNTNGKWYGATVADIATAIRWAASHGADLIASPSYGGTASDVMHSAIVDVTAAGGMGRDGEGCVFLALARNDSGPLTYPAKYPEVVAVGAADHNDVRCHYSNYGPELDIVGPSGWQFSDEDFASSKGLGALWTTDLSGPGGWNADWDSNVLDYTSWTGTCGASSIAAGVAALVLSAEPNLTSDEVRHFLERSAKDLGDPGRDDYYGWGRVDARAALDMVLAKRADLNDNWVVDEEDEAILIAAIDTNDLSGDIAPAAKRDGVVDANDLALLTQYLGTEIPRPGLMALAHWKLNETEGTIAHDNVSGLDAAVFGDAAWQPDAGKIGGALALDGIDDYVKTDFILNPKSDRFELSVWVKGGAPGQVIVSQEGVGGYATTWLGTDPTSGALTTGLVFLNPPLSSDAVITDGQWHEVGVSWDGSVRQLRVDGAVVAEDQTVLYVGFASCEGGLHIGCGPALEPGSFFCGLIDDIRLCKPVVEP